MEGKATSKIECFIIFFLLFTYALFRMEGHGKFTFADGRVYEGGFKDGMLRFVFVPILQSHILSISFKFYFA